MAKRGLVSKGAGFFRHGLPAIIRPIRVLWHEIIWFPFFVLALIAVRQGIRAVREFDGQPKLKFSENFTKITLPGDKAVQRYVDEDAMFYADGICLAHETAVSLIHHPMFPEARSNVRSRTAEQMMRPVMEQGKRLRQASVEEAASYARIRLTKLYSEHKRFENPHVYKVGIWIFRTSPIKNTEGKIVAVLEMNLDITERKELEEKLETSERKYQEIFNHIPNPVFVLDYDSLEILDCNKSVTAVYDLTRQDILGRSFLDLFLPEERSQYAADIRTASELNQIRHFIKTKVGSSLTSEFRPASTPAARRYW